MPSDGRPNYLRQWINQLARNPLRHQCDTLMSGIAFDSFDHKLLQFLSTPSCSLCTQGEKALVTSSKTVIRAWPLSPLDLGVKSKKKSTKSSCKPPDLSRGLGTAKQRKTKTVCITSQRCYPNILPLQKHHDRLSAATGSTSPELRTQLESPRCTWIHLNLRPSSSDSLDLQALSRKSFATEPCCSTKWPNS